MKFEPDIDHLRKWFMAERLSGHGLDHCLRIAEFVYEGKRYDDESKIEFLSRKATLLFNRGRNDISYSPVQGIADVTEALKLHLNCFATNFESQTTKLDKSEEYARNTAFFLFTFLISNFRIDTFFDAIVSLCEKEGRKFDPIEDPLINAFHRLEVLRASKPDLQKTRGRLEYIKRELNKPDKWYDKFAVQRVSNAATMTAESIARRAIASRQ